LVLIQQGRWSEASEITGELLRNPPVAAVNRIPALVAIGRLRARRGAPDAATPLDEALELAKRSGTLPHLGLVLAARTEAAWLAGDATGALAEARSIFNLAVSKRHAWYTGELAFWIGQAGGQVQLPAWTARPFALQVAGDWRAAAAEWLRLGCPYAQGWALAAGDLAAQNAALALFTRLGAGPAAEVLRRRMQAGGTVNLPPRPHSTTRHNPFGLTGRQVEILSLLIAGLSNARIAAELHISPKTTDHHVSAILARLDVHTRQDAADLARRHPFFKK
jgi:DNA-binding CsgD family transcriptional regulator